MKLYLLMLVIIIGLPAFAQTKKASVQKKIFREAYSYSVGEIYETDKAIIRKLDKLRILRFTDFNTALHFISSSGDTLYIPIKRQTLQPVMAIVREHPGTKIYVEAKLFKNYKRHDGSAFLYIYRLNVYK